MRLVLGTRGSELAQAQTAMVEAALRAAFSNLEIAREIIRTSGDERSAPVSPENFTQGRKGMFTAEIERAVRGGRIDVGVHSAKDLPSERAEGLEIAAVLARAAVEDVLVTKEAARLEDLREGATIGTGSVRRQHQLRWLRPDVTVVALRGNVPTRLRKLAEHDWDGIILARAGLERLGLEGTGQFSISVLPREEFLPAGGQGIIALQIRADDETTRELVAKVDHLATHRCLRAEREFLRLLQGDCGTPVGVHAMVENGAIELRAQVFDEGMQEPRLGRSMDASPKRAAAKLFAEMYGEEKEG